MFLVAASRRALRFGSTPQNSRAQRCAPDVCSGATLLRRFRRPGANRVATRHAVWTERRRLAGRARLCRPTAPAVPAKPRRSVVFAAMQAGRLARSLSLLQRQAPRALRRAATAPGTVLRAQAPAPLQASAVRAGARAGVRGGVCASADRLPEAVRCGSPRPRRKAHVATPQPHAVAAPLASFLDATRARAAAPHLFTPADAGYNRIVWPDAALHASRRLWL